MLKFSIQIPIRGEQSYYEDIISYLEKIVVKNFELIVCDDCKGFPPLKPVKTSFPHKMVRIPNREEGWGYPCARNACLDNCTQDIPYMVHLDGDWHLYPDSLEKVNPILSIDTIIYGFKLYMAGKRKGVKRLYRELCILPLDALIKCGGWDELFFPHYGGFWHDMIRRIQTVRKMRIIETDIFMAYDICKMYDFDPRKSVATDLVDELAKNDVRYASKRGLFPVEKVYEHGY